MEESRFTIIFCGKEFVTIPTCPVRPQCRFSQWRRTSTKIHFRCAENDSGTCVFNANDDICWSVVWLAEEVVVPDGKLRLIGWSSCCPRVRLHRLLTTHGRRERCLKSKGVSQCRIVEMHSNDFWWSQGSCPSWRRWNSIGIRPQPRLGGYISRLSPWRRGNVISSGNSNIETNHRRKTFKMSYGRVCVDSLHVSRHLNIFWRGNGNLFRLSWEGSFEWLIFVLSGNNLAAFMIVL